MSRAAVSAMVSLLTLCAFGMAGGSHTSDSLATVKEKVKAGSALLVDVREQAEWDDGHLRDAKLLPLSRLRERPKHVDLKKIIPNKVILYVHCASGRRCLAAAELLKKLGYDARPLRAGYQDLVKAGFPKAAK